MSETRDLLVASVAIGVGATIIETAFAYVGNLATGDDKKRLLSSSSLKIYEYGALTAAAVFGTALVVFGADLLRN